MRSMLALAAATVALVAAPVAGAQTTPNLAPAPHPIVVSLDHTPTVQLSDGAGGLPYLGTATPVNAGDLAGALTTFHDSGVYEHEIGQIDQIAGAWITRAARHGAAMARKARQAAARARRARGHGHGHRREHGGRGPGHGRGALKPAIVFDIDETALSNWTAIKGDNFTYGPQSQAEAVNEIGTAIAPTLALYREARQLGITVFFVTGRGESVRQPTEDNLRREGYATWQQLYLKPAGFSGSTVDYKAGARTDIESQGYRIVANVGDQFSDLAGGHADRAFKLPNPFYYLP